MSELIKKIQKLKNKVVDKAYLGIQSAWRDVKMYHYKYVDNEKWNGQPMKELDDDGNFKLDKEGNHIIREFKSLEDAKFACSSNTNCVGIQLKKGNFEYYNLMEKGDSIGDDNYEKWIKETPESRYLDFLSGCTDSETAADCKESAREWYKRQKKLQSAVYPWINHDFDNYNYIANKYSSTSLNIRESNTTKKQQELATKNKKVNDALLDKGYEYNKELNKAWSGNAIQWESDLDNAIKICNDNPNCIGIHKKKIGVGKKYALMPKSGKDLKLASHNRWVKNKKNYLFGEKTKSSVDDKGSCSKPYFTTEEKGWGPWKRMVEVKKFTTPPEGCLTIKKMEKTYKKQRRPYRKMYKKKKISGKYASSYYSIIGQCPAPTLSKKQCDKRGYYWDDHECWSPKFAFVDNSPKDTLVTDINDEIDELSADTLQNINSGDSTNTFKVLPCDIISHFTNYKSQNKLFNSSIIDDINNCSLFIPGFCLIIILIIIYFNMKN